MTPATNYRLESWRDINIADSPGAFFVTRPRSKRHDDSDGQKEKSRREGVPAVDYPLRQSDADQNEDEMQTLLATVVRSGHW
jgi:hypothetical protein